MANCLLAACGRACIVAANKGQDGDVQPQPSQRNSSLVSCTFTKIQAKCLVPKIWLHVTRHGDTTQNFQQSFIHTLKKSAEPKADYLVRRAVVIVPVGAVERVSAGGCIALSCTAPPVTHRIAPSPTGWNPCRCRMHCVMFEKYNAKRCKAMQVPRVLESVGL